MANDDLESLRKRILLPWQVQRGTNVWSPWGKSGWSAVEIRKPQRKWAKGMRVKPTTGEESAKGKVPMERLLKRDPALKGKDRPGLSPDEVFASVKEEEEEKKETPEKVEAPPPEAPREADGQIRWALGRDIGTHRETDEQQHARLHPPGRKDPADMTEKELKAWNKVVQKVIDLLGDDDNDDDW